MQKYMTSEENKELLSLDSALVVDKLVEERGACKAEKIFKVGQFFANYAVVLEATERSNKLYEEEQKEKATEELIKDTVRKVDAVTAYLRYFDAKKKAVTNKGTTPPAGESIVILKFLFPCIKCVTVK